jgi:hypothetical protein
MKKPAQKAPIIGIRAAKFTDASNIYRIIAASAEQRGHGEPGGWWLTRIAQLIEANSLIVADLSGRIIGALGWEAQDGRHVVELVAVQHGFEDAGVRDALFAEATHFDVVGDAEIVVTVPVNDPDSDANVGAVKAAGFLLFAEVYTYRTPAVTQAELEPEPETDPEALPPPVDPDEEFERRLRAAGG